MSNSSGCMRFGWRNRDSKASKKQNKGNLNNLQSKDDEEVEHKMEPTDVQSNKEELAAPKENEQFKENGDKCSSNSSSETLKSIPTENSDDDKGTKSDSIIKSNASLDESLLRQNSIQSDNNKKSRPVSEDDSKKLDALLEELTSLSTCKLEKPKEKKRVESFDLIQQDLDNFEKEYRDAMNRSKRPVENPYSLNDEIFYNSTRNQNKFGRWPYNDPFRPISRYSSLSPTSPYSNMNDFNLLDEPNDIQLRRNFSTGSQPNINYYRLNYSAPQQRDSLNRRILPSLSSTHNRNGRWPEDYLTWSDDDIGSGSLESMKANRLGFSYDNHRSMVSRSSYSDAPLFEGFGTQDGDYETEENLKMGHRNYYGGEMSSATYEQNTSYFRSAHATIEQEREISVPGPVIEEFETVEMIPIGQGVQTFRTGHSTPGPRTPQFSGHINSMSNSRTLPSGRPPIQPQRINQANVSRTSSLPPGARNMRRVAQYAPPQSAVSVAHIHHFPDNSTRVCNNPDCLDQLTNQQFGISTSGTFHQERLPPETPIANHSAKYVAPNIPVFDETDTEVRRGHKFDDWYTGRRRIEALESEPAHLTNFNKIVRDDAPSWNIHMQTDTLSDERNLPITVSNSLQTQSAIPNDTIEPPMRSIDLISMTKKIWYKPDLSREEAFNLLKNCKPGTFVIRSSASFQNSLGLAIKVGQIPEDITPKSTNLEQELVRHYLIEKNKHGVRIRGSPEEPQFRSLEHLIDEHSRKKISLPIILRLPQLPSNMRESPLILPRSELNLGLEVKPPAYNTNSSNRNFTQSSSKMKTLDQIDVSNKPSARPSHIDSAASSDGETFMAYLIGQVHIEQMTGEQGLVQALANIKRDRMLIECRFKVGPDGLLLTDVNRKLFFREHIPWQIVSFFGSTSQRWNIDTNQKSSSVFGFVLKKPREENKAYLFAEMDSPSNVIVNAVSKYLPKTQITAL